MNRSQTLFGKKEFVIQRFIPSKGMNASILRVDWSEKDDGSTNQDKDGSQFRVFSIASKKRMDAKI